MSPDSTMTSLINHPELSFVQNIVDSNNQVKGNLYIQKLNDSLFSKLVIYRGSRLVYYATDSIVTNFIDTIKIDPKKYLGLKFLSRSTIYVSVILINRDSLPGSDPWIIQYMKQKDIFDNPLKYERY